LGYISVALSTQYKITQTWGLLRRSRSFKVT